MGLLRFVNDSHVLRLSSMYKKTMYRGLLDMDKGTCIDIPPYLLGDKGYPLILKLWLHSKKMVNIVYMRCYIIRSTNKNILLKKTHLELWKKYSRSYLGSQNSMWFFILDVFYMLSTCTTCWDLKVNFTFSDWCASLTLNHKEIFN